MKLLLLKENNGVSIHRDKTGSYYITKRKSREGIYRNIDKRLLTLRSNSLSDNGISHELLKINHITNFEIVNLIFQVIANSDQTIYTIINDLEALLLSPKILDLEMARGIFSELYTLSKDRTIIASHSNAIYDFNKDHNDFEIKSASKAKTTVKISLQQASNNPNALVRINTIIETSGGQTIRELLSKIIDKERYIWLLDTQSKFLDVHFAVLESSDFVMKDLIGELKLGENIIDATLEVKFR